MFLAIISELLLIVAITAVFVLWVAYRNIRVEKTNLAAQLIVEKMKVSLADLQIQNLQEDSDKWYSAYLREIDEWHKQYKRADKAEKALSNSLKR